MELVRRASGWKGEVTVVGCLPPASSFPSTPCCVSGASLVVMEGPGWGRLTASGRPGGDGSDLHSRLRAERALRSPPTSLGGSHSRGGRRREQPAFWACGLHGSFPSMSPCPSQKLPHGSRAQGLYVIPLTLMPREKEGGPWRYLWKILDQSHCKLDVGEAEEELQPRGYPNRGHNHGGECEEPGERQEAKGQLGHMLAAALRNGWREGREGWR